MFHLYPSFFFVPSPIPMRTDVHEFRVSSNTSVDFTKSNRLTEEDLVDDLQIAWLTHEVDSFFVHESASCNVDHFYIICLYAMSCAHGMCWLNISHNGTRSP